MIIDERAFQTYKTSAVLFAFFFSALCQFALPYKKDFMQILGNWRINLSLGIVNAILLYLVCGACVCQVAIWAHDENYGLLNWLRLSGALPVALSVFILDFIAYAWHRANHQIPLLWRFHRLHHSDSIFDTSTAVRFHPGELFISLVVRIFVVVSFGVPVLGLIVFEMIYACFNFFEHGNIRLAQKAERMLQFIFVTPAWHRFHHSALPAEHNRNFSTIFSFWDRLWRTDLIPRMVGPKTLGLIST